MFQIEKGKNKNFNILTANHIDLLFKPIPNFNGVGFPYGNGSVAKRVNKAINNMSGVKGISFFRDLKDSNYSKLKLLLSGSPVELQKLVNEYKNKVRRGELPSFVGDPKTNVFVKNIKYVFNYITFSKDHAYNFTNELDVNVCPYCNRNYIFTVEDSGAKIVRPELDHFYCQKYYPYLAISFFNLIPSCHICNSNIKKEMAFNLKDFIQPFQHSFDNILRFSVSFKKRKKSDFKTQISKGHVNLGLYSGNIDAFNIVFKANNKHRRKDNHRAKNHAKAFRLQELYNYHRDLVVEMIQTSVIYNNSKINELFKQYEGKIFSSKDEVKMFITKNYFENDKMHLRPFSKLSKDIHREFGIKI